MNDLSRLEQVLNEFKEGNVDAFIVACHIEAMIQNMIDRAILELK